MIVFADLSSEKRCRFLQKFMNSLSRSLELTAAAEIVCRAATLKYANQFWFQVTVLTCALRVWCVYVYKEGYRIRAWISPYFKLSHPDSD